MTCLRCWRQDVGKPRGPGELGSAAKLLLEDGDGEPSDLDVLRQERSLLASGFTEVRPVVWHVFCAAGLALLPSIRCLLVRRVLS